MMGKSNARKGLHKIGNGLGYREKERIPDRIKNHLRVATLRRNLAEGVRVRGEYFGVPYRGVVSQVLSFGYKIDLAEPITLDDGRHLDACWIVFDKTILTPICDAGVLFAGYEKSNVLSLKLLG